MSLPSEDVPDLQHEVQRRLGRNLLRLQQLEGLTKAIIATTSFEGHPEELMANLQEQKSAASTKTLGQAIGSLTTDYLVSSAPADARNREYPDDSGHVWMRASFSLEMAQEDHLLTKQRFAELVDLRNDMVHHFIENHDLRSDKGCLQALQHLDDVIRLIDERLAELKQFAQYQEQVKVYCANLMQSNEFEEFIVHGILPGGTGAIWELSTIVNLLRKAEEVLIDDGWTSLAKAIAYITEREPTHTPRRYGCSSWRHVLHESAPFDIRREQPEPERPRETLFRSRKP